MMENKSEDSSGARTAGSRGAACSVDRYGWWVGVIMGIMACLIVCVICGQGISAIAFAIVIHTAAKIQRWESKR